MKPLMSVNIDRVFRYTELSPETLTARTAVVIDLLRASSSICFALAAGCEKVIPFLTVEQLREYAARQNRNEIILGGERESLLIDGFDIGNSPQGYTPGICHGKTLLTTTTNGTKAIHAAAQATTVLLACLANVDAVAEALAAAGADIILVCSGTNDHPAPEDTIGAGSIIKCLEKCPGEYHHSPAARKALDLYEANKDDIAAALLDTEAGRSLVAVGLAEDVIFCAAPPRLDIAPRLDRATMTIFPK